MLKYAFNSRDEAPPLILVTALLTYLRSEAVIILTSLSSTWGPVMYLSDADPTDDQQT